MEKKNKKIRWILIWTIIGALFGAFGEDIVHIALLLILDLAKFFSTTMYAYILHFTYFTYWFIYVILYLPTIAMGQVLNLFGIHIPDEPTKLFNFNFKYGLLVVLLTTLSWAIIGALVGTLILHIYKKLKQQ